MKTAMRSRIIHIAAGILTVVLLAVVLVSSFYIAEEADHDCEGEDCPICETIRQCEALLHQVGLGIILVASTVVPTVWSVLTGSLRACDLPQETLVSMKVRLND